MSGFTKAGPRYKPRFSIAFTAAAVLVAHAAAAPPPPNSIDAQIMQGYGSAIKQLVEPGSHKGCCDASDCRPADYRIKTDNGATRYEVFVRSKTPDGSGWDKGTDEWEPVPENAVIPPEERKGIPFPTACWIKERIFYAGSGFLCFTPGDGM